MIVVPMHAPAAPPLIECRDVTVYRGDVRALDRLTLTIAAAEHVAILGPNGCGKSTLIKTLTCDCYPAIEPVPSTLRIMGRDRRRSATLQRSRPMMRRVDGTGSTAG